MSEYLDLSPKVIGPESDGGDTGDSGAWVIVEQDNIPEDQQQVTAAEAKSMLAAALSGYTAFRGRTTCPVRKQSVGAGNYIATYTATILIHKSNQIVDYDLTVTKDGIPISYSPPRREYRNKSKSYDINYINPLQLGWQPFDGFVGVWNEAFGVWDTKSSRIAPINRPVIDQYDGFLTLKGDLVFGIVKARALAVMDVVTIPIKHQLGTEWGSTVKAEVSWPAGASYDLQDHAECDVLLPQCVEDAFNECAFKDADGNLIADENDHWEVYFIVGPSGPTVVFWNKCTQQVIEVTNDNREEL